MGIRQSATLFIFAAVLMYLLPCTDASCLNQPRCRNEYSSTTRKFYRAGCCLTHVPQDIPAEALEVYLWNNAITALPTGLFSDLNQWEDLRLEYNKISVIEDQAFSGLESLWYLDLKNNKISVLKPGMFTGLKNVWQLHVPENQITHVQEGTFDSLVSIGHINLQQNRLTTLSPEVFRNLGRPLQLLLSPSYTEDTNQWDCSSLCWLKHEEQNGTVQWWSNSYPRCASGADWKLLECENPGEPCSQKGH